MSLPAFAIDNSKTIAALLAKEAEDIRGGHFHLLGAQWPQPSTVPFSPEFWHIDPDDGAFFSQRNSYCFDMSFRHGVNTRELKRIWELNRLQFLVPLAADAMIRNYRKSADLAISFILSWMEGNFPFCGPNWVFGIELALRIISVALTVSIIGVDYLSETARTSVLKLLFTHVDWIKRFPSLHSSANNHRIAELVGLIVGTIVAPGIPNSETIREDSWRALLVEIDRQIYPDGVGVEQSPGYTAFSIELFLVAATAWGRARDLPQATIERLSNWAEHSLWLMNADCSVPAIGDFDDCRAIATTQAPEPRYVASIVAAVAGCINRPDLAPTNFYPNIRNIYLASAKPHSAYRAGVRSFVSGGYSEIRVNRSQPFVLIFDHGPIGYLGIAAHGHADALSIWLSVGDKPVFVDAGTYRYHSSRLMRDTFRETAVHNTLTLDGIPSSCPSGPFNWSKKASARLIESRDTPTALLTAEHDGYLSKYGVRHRRTIEFDGGCHLTIVDELVGPPTKKRVAVSFLLDPTCNARIDPEQSHVLISRD